MLFSAAYMADAYARVTGRVGVCEGPSGGGATYILPGLVEAIRRRTADEDRSRGLYLLSDHRNRVLAGNLSGWPDERTDAQGWVTFRLGFPESEGGGTNFGRARVLRGDGFQLLVGHDERERTWVQSTILWTLVGSLAATVTVALLGAVLMSRALLRRIDAITVISREIIEKLQLVTVALRWVG